MPSIYVRAALQLVHALLYPLLDGLVRAEQRLLVDDDVRRVRARAAHARGDRGGVGVDDDPADKSGASACARGCVPRRKGGRHAPVVDGLVETQQDEVEVLEHATLLELVAQEHEECVGEGVQCGGEHELVLGRRGDEVEDEVERVLVHGEVGVVEDDVAWRGYVNGYCGTEGECLVRASTSRFFCLLPEPLLEGALLLEGQETAGLAVWMVFWTVVFCEDAVALCVENEEGIDAV